MPPEPAPEDPGWDDDLAWLDRDPATARERAEWLDRVCEADEPPELEEFEDFDPLTAEELAEVHQAAADDLLAVKAATTGRRGPGQPGSARVFPGESSSRVAGFGPGMPLDVLPGGAGLAVAADAAAGEDRFDGISEAELVGLLCAWDRVEAHAAARKLAVVAEVARRNPAPEDEEFTADQIACALGESRARAGDLMGLAGHLDTHLPGTRAALRDGTISLGKARVIAAATAVLDEAEAAEAEAGVLDRAASLTPGGLRAAIARAVMEAAPEKAKKRREAGARFARVERWAEDHQASGHDPGVKLRHLAQVRHATCTSPICRRPAAQCDHEHNIPYEAGGRTCLCNTGPKCRHDHRLKQHPKWTVDQLPDGTFRWTTPAGRTYTTEPTRYPI